MREVDFFWVIVPGAWALLQVRFFQVELKNTFSEYIMIYLQRVSVQRVHFYHQVWLQHWMYPHHNCCNSWHFRREPMYDGFFKSWCRPLGSHVVCFSLYSFIPIQSVKHDLMLHCVCLSGQQVSSNSFCMVVVWEKKRKKKQFSCHVLIFPDPLCFCTCSVASHWGVWLELWFCSLYVV